MTLQTSIEKYSGAITKCPNCLVEFKSHHGYITHLFVKGKEKCMRVFWEEYEKRANLEIRHRALRAKFDKEQMRTNDLVRS
jgi:hypothetical protein